MRRATAGSGNRIWEERPSGATWSAIGPGSELVGSLSVTRQYPIEWPRWQKFEHDADGNLQSDGKTKYTWNAAGKPVSSVQGGVTTTYQHSGDGRRVAQTTKGVTTSRFVWDPLSPQILASGNGTDLSRYTYGEALLASTKGARTTPMVTGPTGSVLMAGAEHRDFEPYGVARGANGAVGAEPGYAGGLQLPGGTYLFGQREYDPAAGSFLSPDQGGSDQAYGYASGNPLTFSDLTGMSDDDQVLASVARISGYVSTGALVVALGCTAAIVCAPAVPIALGISAVTGTVAGVSDGILSARACQAKGNCSRLLADLALIAVTSRLPAVRSVSRVGRTAGGFCSFSGDTEVLMADGSSKPISEVEAGDRVYAADPETGESGTRAVTRTWLHRDTVVDLDLGGSVVTTTEDHPFWNDYGS